MSEQEERGLTRRELLVKGGIGAAGIAGLGALAGPAAAHTAKAGKYTGTINVIGLGVDLIDPVKKQAEKDLGFSLNFTVTDSVTMVQKAISAPDSFDLFSGYNYQYFQIWPSGNLQPVDISKIKSWNQQYKLFTWGKVTPGSNCTYGDGDAPFRANFVDTTGKYPLTKEGPANNKQIVQWIDESTGKPYKGLPQPKHTLGPTGFFNMDSMGYNGDVIRLAPNKVSWGQLLNPQWKGRVAILNDPGIGMQDAGNAVKALGLMKFKDLGNMTKAEMDGLMKILTVKKKAGQFRSFWTTFNESVNLMSSKEVVIESMWSPAVALLAAQGFPIRFAAPPEGYRGWTGAMGISSKVTDPAKLQACYDYINWMYSGFFGALIMRQGYYVGNGAQLPKWINSAAGKAAGFSMAEYDFWYNGKPAVTDLPGITGQVGDIKKGQTRDGGSFVQRACKYSSWNSYFRENVYQVKSWNTFLTS